MPEIFLNRPNPNSGEPSDKMPRAVFFKIMEFLAAERAGREITLNAAWEDPPEYLDEIIKKLNSGPFLTTVRMDLQSVGNLGRRMIEAGFRLVVELDSKTDGSWSPEGLNRGLGVSLFYPAPAPEVDPGRLIELITKLPHLEKVVIGAGWRDALSGPSLFPESEFAVWAATLEDLITDLTAHKTTAALACGLPLCLFSGPELGRLAALKVRWPIAGCDPPLVVFPNGEAAPCLKLDSPKRIDLLGGEPLSRILAGIQDRLNPFRQICDLSDELTCRSRKTGACGQGCLAWNMSAWKGPNRP